MSLVQLVFRLGSIPVIIRPAFIFLVIFLALMSNADGQHKAPQLVMVWGVIAFVSVLVHELGHALVGRRFGLEPQIQLNGFGGLTTWANPKDVGNSRSILISLAGPFAGFALAGLLFGARKLGLGPQSEMLSYAIHQAILVNVVWGVYNLVPMLPLDGGNVMRSFLHILTKGEGEKPSRIVSVIVGGMLLVAAVAIGQLWLGMLAAFFTWANITAYRQVDALKANIPLAKALEEAQNAVEHDDGAKAIEVLRPVIVPQASVELRVAALRLFCYALLLEGQWAELIPTLQHNAVLIGQEEIRRYAFTAFELGHKAEAHTIGSLLNRIAPIAPRPANDFG